jgi:hypothetical protein
MTNLTVIFEQKKLNSAAEVIELPQAFTDKFPDLKRPKAEKLFQRYLDTVVDTLLGRLSFLKDGETFVSTQALFERCGEFQYKNTRHFVWNEFKDIYPLLVVVEKGSNLKATTNAHEKNSRVKITNERFLTMLLHERSPTSVYEHYFKDVDFTASDFDQVLLDMENLERFIGSTEYELSKQPAGNYRKKLEKSLWQAMLVQKIGQYTDEKIGVPVLPMIHSPSAFGRLYYKGINIQNVTKEVRSALLGHHYQYDMNAASFAIKLWIYGEINGGDNQIIGTTKGTYTREYLANKDHIRNRLARECFDGINLDWKSKVKNIKNALTAIGFGAKTTGKTWMTDEGLKGTALSEILVAPQAREAFLQDPWVKSFLAEQTIIEDAILDCYKATDEWDNICQIVRASNGANGKTTRAGLLAYIYQQWERDIMDDAVSVLERNGISVIARIHDAFVVRDPVPTRVMDEIAAAWGLRDYMKLDRDEVSAWVGADYKRAMDAANIHLDKHKAAIEREERNARIQKLLGAA